MKSNNVIEINGRLYDATTGVPLSKSETSAQPQSAQSKSPRARSVDGLMPRSQSAALAKKQTLVAQTKQKKSPQHSDSSKKITPSTGKRTPAPSMSLKARHSTTLHRRTVKKPVFEHPKASHAAPVSSTALKHAETERETRAATVEKSSAIQHFHAVKHTASKTQADSSAHTPKAEPATHKPQEAPEVKHHTKNTPTLSTKEQLINQALAKAALDNNKTPARHARTKRTRSHGFHITRYAATASVVVILTGYVAYLNVPSLSMKVAAHRAGFAANLPGYNPSGYSLSGPISYSPGQVTINFSSNADGKRFSLTQQPTSWDSTALLENYVSKRSPNYLTYQDSGLTIYIYDGSSASWVNGGKMYHLEGNNSQLDTDQLLKFATSV